MTKRGWIVGAALLAVVGLFPSVAGAEGCRSDQKLEIIGQLQTGSAVISTSGHEVRLINITCTSTACVGGLYDADTLGTASNALVRLEPGTPASQTALVPQSGFLEQPLYFSNGITFVDDGNVAAIALYECVQK